MLKSILKRYHVRFSILRAVVSNYRESAARSINSNFFFFHQNKHFGKLFSKTIFKRSSEAPFLRKTGMFKIGLNLVEGPKQIMQITAFSKCS